MNDETDQLAAEHRTSTSQLTTWPTKGEPAGDPDAFCLHTGDFEPAQKGLCNGFGDGILETKLEITGEEGVRDDRLEGEPAPKVAMGRRDIVEQGGVDLMVEVCESLCSGDSSLVVYTSLGLLC